MSLDRTFRLSHSQNVLHCPRLVTRLVDRSSIGASDLVVEIGPGRGIVTAALSNRCRQVLAVEKDPDLVDHLRHRFAETGNVAIFAADFLHVPLPVSRYKIFSNIPFDHTAAIVGKLTSGTSPPDDAYLVVQREAADRFLGTPRETMVSVLLKPWFEPFVVHRFRPTDFRPVPRVESVLLRLRRREAPLIDDGARATYRDFVAHAFTAWRPTLRAVLEAMLEPAALARVERAAGVDLRRRPTHVPFADWLFVFAALMAGGGDRAFAAVAGAEGRLRVRDRSLRKRHRSSVARSVG